MGGPSRFCSWPFIIPLAHCNDLFLSSNYLSFILFADDTNTFLRHKDLASLTRMVNQELSHVSSWFNANKNALSSVESRSLGDETR